MLHQNKYTQTLEKLKAQQKKLEAEFDSKNITFQEAINNMKISIHPILYELKELFHQLDNIPFSPKIVKTDIAFLGLMRYSSSNEQTSYEYLVELLEP